MAQQTAVNFLVNYMLENFHLTDYTVMVVFEQAKQMEKDQIIKAYSNGSNDRLHNFINNDYYNETYNK